MRKLIILCLGLLLAACSANNEIDPAQQAALLPDGKVELNKIERILVLPFTSAILPPEQSATAVMLQNQLAGQMVYTLQSAGFAAELLAQDINEWDAAQPASYATLLPKAYGPGENALPAPGKLGAADIAATSFEEVTDWDTQVVPVRDSRQFGKAVPSTAIGDTDYLPAQLAVDEPDYFAKRKSILDRAAKEGYDHVLIGTIALVRTEVSPTIRIRDSERATVRSELNCAFQLLSTKDGAVDKLGAARGRDAKMVIIKDGNLTSYHFYSALDKVMQQSIFNVAKRVAEQVSDKKLDSIFLEEDAFDEASYYQDTPGKRLKNK